MDYQTIMHVDIKERNRTNNEKARQSIIKNKTIRQSDNKDIEKRTNNQKKLNQML